MEEGRKLAVSLRLSPGDIRKVKKLAQRLGASDSDIIRFALKSTLARLAPLCDHSLRGRALLPVFLEAGSDLFKYFDLDAARLEEIVNTGVSKSQEVALDDLQLIALAGAQQTYARPRLDATKRALAKERSVFDQEDRLSDRLRGYLYSKYIQQEPASDVVIE